MLSDQNTLRRHEGARGHRLTTPPTEFLYQTSYWYEQSFSTQLSESIPCICHSNTFYFQPMTWSEFNMYFPCPWMLWYQKSEKEQLSVCAEWQHSWNVCWYSNSRYSANITSFIAHSIPILIHSSCDLRSSITFTSRSVLLGTVSGHGRTDRHVPFAPEVRYQWQFPFCTN